MNGPDASPITLAEWEWEPIASFECITENDLGRGDLERFLVPPICPPAGEGEIPLLRGG